MDVPASVLRGPGCALGLPEKLRVPRLAHRLDRSCGRVGGVRDLDNSSITPRPLRHPSSWPLRAAGTSNPAGFFCEVLAATVTVPIAEELAFRGFLLRRFISPDFEAISFQTFSWFALLASSVIFGLLHGQRWIAGTLAGGSLRADDESARPFWQCRDCPCDSQCAAGRGRSGFPPVGTVVNVSVDADSGPASWFICWLQSAIQNCQRPVKRCPRTPFDEEDSLLCGALN